MIQEDYVSCETAKLLKEKGFNEECWEYYDNNKNFKTFKVVRCNYDNIPYKNAYIVPTLQKAMKWLREVHKIHVAIYPYGDYSCDNYQFDVYKDNNFVVSKDDGYMTYEEACEAAIKYCLKNLLTPSTVSEQ